MSIHLNRKLAITLLFSLALLLALAGPSSANASPHRRDHLDLNRMIKKRAVAPSVDTANPTPSTTPSSPSPSVAPQPAAPVTSAQPSPSAATSAPGPASQSAASTQAQSSTGAVPPATALTPTPSTSTPSQPQPATSNTPTPLTQANKPSVIANGQPSVGLVTLTSHLPAASSAAANNNAQLGASSLSHTTRTILIVLAASVGGCAIIWTVIRKWKFRPSAEFEDRLEPVNWQPAEHDSGLPTHRKMPSNASSFHSAGHENMAGLGRSNSNAAPRSLSPLPDHDFTAGAATLAPGGGYADLARGPGLQPQMQEALHRGPSVNRGYPDYPPPVPQYQGQDVYGPRY
jgi:hypothetical protein